MADVERICKTDAKKKYILTEKDLRDADLEHIEKKNPRYRSAKPMILYDEDDIIELFCKKYLSTPENVDDRIAELKEKKRIKKLIKQNSPEKVAAREREEREQQEEEDGREKRKNELQQAFAQYRLEIRNDSKLCSDYIEGVDNGYSLADTVRRTAEMRYLYDYCDMRGHVDYYIGKFKREHREMEFFDRDEFKDGCDKARRDAERAALLVKSKGQYPDVWPWMNK